MDYLKYGVQLELSFAIDYTDSNGDCDKPISLHYMGSGHVSD